MRNTARLLFIILIVSACGSSGFYEENYDLKTNSWAIEEVPEFTFYIEDTSKRYDMDVVIRYSNRYRFQNLYVTRILEDRRGRKLDSTLVNLQMFDEKTGRPLGSGLGDIFTISEPILDSYGFNKPDTFRLRVRQTMRPDTLKEVVSVGLLIKDPSQD